MELHDFAKSWSHGRDKDKDYKQRSNHNKAQMGQKRPRDETMDQKDESPFLPMFENFRKELDEHHDRRERTIKASRDVTAASKKM